MGRAPEVVFEIWGPAIDPEAVTRLLGIGPSESCAKGPYELRDLDGTVFKGHSPSGSWLLRSGDCVQSASPEAHVEYVLGLLRAHRDALRPLAAAAELAFFLRLPAGSASPYPKYRQIEAALRELELGIDFDALPDSSSSRG